MDVRKEVLEFGLLPTAVLPTKFDTVSAVADLHSKLLKETETIDGQRGQLETLDSPTSRCCLGFVSIASVRRRLNLSTDVWNLLYNVIDSISCRSARKRWRLCSVDETRIELHSLSLFLFTQVYGKQASKRTDHELKGSKKETVTARGMAPRGLSTLTFSSFLRRHLQTLLYLIKDNPPELSSPGWCLPRSPSPGVTVPPEPTRGTIWISREEVDRLEILLKRRLHENGDGRRELDHEMDAFGVASCLPCFKNYNKEVFAAASCIEVATCLKASILDTEGDTDVSAGSGRICGMTKGTLVEGEDSFPDDQLVIHECQDSCIYALAPMARVKVTACSDCIIVLGPTSGCVLVENCTRIKLILAATSTFITACHESIVHLATTRPPVLYGDNRILQLAPFNIEYERLSVHLKMAGLSVSPNRWDQPILCRQLKDYGREEGTSSPEPAHLSSGVKQKTAESVVEDILLPPDQLLPFTVPFKGGPGPLAGGAPTNSQISWVNRLGSGMGNGPSFPLSPHYANALTARLRKVAELQESVGKAISDLNNRRDIQVAIQRYFKEWLFKTAKIRQVYDLAKLEQQMISETSMTANGTSTSSTSTSQ